MREMTQIDTGTAQNKLENKQLGKITKEVTPIPSRSISRQPTFTHFLIESVKRKHI